MKQLKLISFFAGIGGIDLGFRQAGVQPIWANEIDPYCGQTFLKNWTDTALYIGDIYTVKQDQLPDCDILAGGFPCQAFSIAGLRKGFDDERGILFFQLERIIRELKEAGRQPKVVFFENVKNLYSINNGETYKIIKQKLIDLGYFVDQSVLNTRDFGNLPQNRERLYIVGFLDEAAFKRFKWPEKIELTNTTEKLIDWKSNGIRDTDFYDERYKVFPIISEGVKKNHTIYQLRRVYMRENQTGVCPALTANMGGGGHNVPLIKDDFGRIRKLTIHECQLIQGFPESFSFPSDMADSRIYKQIGNSVSVNVIRRIAKQIIEALINE